MAIEIVGITKDRALRTRVTARLSKTLAALSGRTVAAQVRFTDENGPKGGVAIRCAFSVRVPRRPTIQVEQVAETPRLAFDAGLETLARELKQYRERQRDVRRRPKKYFIAKRLLAPDGAAAGQ